ncbi:MAG: hypothetical protein ABSB94_16830 [Syntrophorhabdales bacterium]|jgi:hypothetical protein
MAKEEQWRSARFLVIGCVALFLAACPMGPFGTIITPEQKGKIMIGKTTKVELLKEIGTPDQIIDLGAGKEQFSYITERVTSYGIKATSENTEFWLVLKNGVVTDYGERATTKSPKYIK